MAKSKVGRESIDIVEIVRLVVKSSRLDPCRSHFRHLEFFFVKFEFHASGLVFHY